MKKYLLSACALAAAFAASAFNYAPIESNVQLGDLLNAKPAPKEVVAKLAEKTVAARAPKKINTPVTVASDLEGGYSWAYDMASERAEDPSTVTPSGSYTQDVLIYGADDAAGTFKIAGMFDAAITGTLDLTTYDYPTFTISDTEEVAYTSNYGSCTVRGVFYYSGDDTNQAGFYYTDNVAFVIDGEIIWASNVWMVRIISSGQYAGYSLTPYYMPNSTMTAKEGVNGIMEYRYNDAFDMMSPVSITEDENYVVSVGNFAGLAENPVTINLEEGRTWTADPVGLFTNDNGTYVLYGTDGDNLFDLTGTGTETVLTFGSDWTGYDTETNYWLGQRGAATITLLDGEFVYPGEEQPEQAMYLIGSFNEWNEETQLPMTLDATTGKWAITQEMEAGAEFKLRNENGEWIGGFSDGNFVVTQEQVENGTELALLTEGGMNFYMPVAGTWTLTVDREAMTMVISGEWVEPVEENHLYILGTVGDQQWAPNVGTEMEATGDNVYEYTGTFNANSYISFTKKLAETADGWDAIKVYRVGAQSNDFDVDANLNQAIALGEWGASSDNAFMLAAGGEYTITVDLNEMTVLFTKAPVNVESITLNVTDEDEVTLDGGQTLQLIATVLPENADNKEVTWSTSDASVATVDETGLVTAQTIEEMPIGIKRAPADGEDFYYVPATITATSVANPDVTASVTLYVKVNVIISAINDVNSDDVVSVKYVNAQGQTANTPFNGVNIKVTTHSNGSTHAVKVVK